MLTSNKQFPSSKPTDVSEEALPWRYLKGCASDMLRARLYVEVSQKVSLKMSSQGSGTRRNELPSLERCFYRSVTNEESLMTWA